MLIGGAVEESRSKLDDALKGRHVFAWQGSNSVRDDVSPC
jgi:hypothetical protein